MHRKMSAATQTEVEDFAMPRGIPNKKDGQAEISKMEAVRRALGELGAEALPVAIQEFVKSNFKIEMQTGMISSYKSSLSKKATGESRTIRIARAPVARGMSLEDIRAVKELVDRLGADKVRDLAELLAR